jgi:phage FluMu protein Com
MLQLQDSLSDPPYDATEPSTIVCKDCKSTVPIASLIPVDALHKQCPRCLYIFFFKETPTSDR